jgi:hypothetical protein
VAVGTPLSNIGFPPVSYGCEPTNAQSTVPACVFGDRHGSHTMVLYGDSHAGMWFRALDDIATGAHWRLVLLFKPACFADPLPTHPPMALGQVSTACAQWHRFAINRINRLDPALLIVTQYIGQTPSGSNYTPAQWETGMMDLLKQITAPKTKKVVLGNIPTVGGPYCLSRHINQVQTCAGVPLISYNRAERSGAEAEGARYISVTPWFCLTTCSSIIGNYDAYFNTLHVAVGYSRVLEGVLSQALDLTGDQTQQQRH